LLSFSSPMKIVQMKSISMYHGSQGEGHLFLNDK
jgi:hypothetical protein